MFEGVCCQPLRQSQEHGKANTELISKTSKKREGGASCQKSLAPVLLSLVSLPLSRPLSPLLLPLYPFIHKLFFPLKIGTSYATQTAPPLPFWPVPGVKAPGIVSVSPVREQCGAAMPGHQSHPSHIKRAHTQNKLFF